MANEYDGINDVNAGEAKAPPPLRSAEEIAEERTSVPQQGTVDATPQAAPQGFLAKALTRFREPAAKPTREAKSTDRARGVIILGAASVACMFLFFGLFTSDSSEKEKREGQRKEPSLGRPATPLTDTTGAGANRSAVPQLSTKQDTGEEAGELTEADLAGTIRHRESSVPKETVTESAPVQKGPTIGTVNFDDPVLEEAYRRQATRKAQAIDWNQTDAKPDPPSRVASNNDGLQKSSIVFVRSGTVGGSGSATTIPAFDREPAPSLLPQGTALVARLQYAVSSAAKVPVSAVVEYNYENNGQLVIPAGTKAYGELVQATSQGLVNLQFKTLELPNGETEKINASALSMQRELLKGAVSGRNTGKRFLTRTFTGIGTIASFAVGGRGLSSNFDNSVLLRERIASNIGMAGEQELGRLANENNIVVTVPAKTRFYLVLYEAGVSRTGNPGTASPVAGPKENGPRLEQTSYNNALSEEELRELRKMRDEMRQMNQLMQNSPKTEPDQTGNNR